MKLTYKINAISYMWNDHSCYLGKIRYQDLNSIVDIKSDLSMNRDIDEDRVDKIKDYLEREEVSNAFFPPAILSSSVKMSYNIKSNNLEVKEGKFTVIDGQHRIKAIIQSINNSEKDIRKKFNEMELPVLIIEGLEIYQHRNLFSLINETAKKVDSNISERFSEKLENLIGLRFLSENIEHSANIEWEKKQSFDESKIAYMHLTDCIRELHNELFSHLKDHFKESELLHRNEKYFSILSYFLNQLLKYIFDLSNEEKKFFTKKITLRAIVLDICDEITKLFASKRANSLDLEECVELIKEKIELSLKLTLNKPVIHYSGELGTKLRTYKTRRHFLVMNGFIYLFGLNQGPVTTIIQKVIDSYYDNDKSLNLSPSDYQDFFEVMNLLLEKSNEITQIDIKNIDDNQIDKNNILNEVITIIERALDTDA